MDPAQTLAALHEAGFDVCAYISCFLDPAAAEWETDMAVLKGTDGGGVWLDDSGAGWLNPYAERARAYISQIAAAAASAVIETNERASSAAKAAASSLMVSVHLSCPVGATSTR